MSRNGVGALLPDVEICAAWGYTSSTALSAIPGGAWVDITDDVEFSESSGYQVVRGRQDEQGTCDTTITFTIDNRTGAYTPGYQPGSNWPNVVRTTPIRIRNRFPSVSGTWTVRAIGYVDSWGMAWPGSGDEFSTQDVTVVGRLKLTASEAPLGCAVELVTRSAKPSYYYKLDEAYGSASFLDYSGNGRPSVPVPTWWTPGQTPDGIPAGLDKVTTIDPTFTNNGVRVNLSSHTPGTATSSFSFAFRGSSAVSSFPAVTLVDTRSNQWALGFSNTGGADLSVGPITTLGVGVDALDAGFGTSTNYCDDAWHIAQVNFSTGIDAAHYQFVTVYLDGVSVLAQWFAWTTGTPATFPPITFAYAILSGSVNAGATDTNPSGLAHFATYSDVPATLYSNLETAMVSLYGQTITQRLQLLSTSVQIPATVPPQILDVADTTGANRADVMRSAISVEDGLLCDSMDGASGDLRWISSLTKENAAVWLALNAAAEEVMALTPVYDTQRLANDVTVTAPSGDQRQISQSSTDANGAFSLSADTDGLAPDALIYAQWLLNTRKDLAVRYPNLSVDLGNVPGAMTTWQSGDPLWRQVSVSNPPSQILGPLYAFVEGYTETVTAVSWTADLNCSPADPWTRCFTVADSTLGRVGMDAQTSGTGASTGTGTGAFQILTPTGGILVTTAVGDFPCNFNLGGECVTLSGVTGSSSPQTGTISARGVNGTTAKAHVSGTSFDLWTPPVLAIGGLN